jgi:hypothetical protein
MLLFLFIEVLCLSILVVQYFLIVMMMSEVEEEEVWEYEFCMIRDADEWEP